MNNNLLNREQTAEYFKHEFENDIVCELEKINQTSLCNIVKNSFVQDLDNDIMGQIELENNEKIGFFYSKTDG